MFSGLSPTERIRIILDLTGVAGYVAGMEKSAAATMRNVEAQRALELSMRQTNQRTFLHQQALFTARRYTFYATLAVTALAFEVGRLGLSYYNTTQTAMVGFTGLLHSTRAARKELDLLYALAAATPFEFTDIVKAARLIQPYTNNLALTNRTVKDLTNTLSAAGQLTGAAMQRAALQMSHMFTIGRLTGQVLLALSRDFVPMNIALQHYLHMTGEQIRQQVAGGFISAKIAAQALHDYIMADTGRSMAGFNQATQTLVGSWSTLKDLIGMSAASGEGGIFEHIRKSIKGIDLQLLSITNSGRHLTMMDFMGAVDRQFSPHTHAIINTFILLTTAIKTLAVEFGALFYAIGILLRPFDFLGSLFGQNRLGAKLLGYALGTVAFLLLLTKIRTFALAEANAIAAASEIVFARGILFTSSVMKGLNLLMAGQLIGTMGKWAFAETQAGHAGAKLGEKVFVNNGLFAKLTRVLFRSAIGIWGIVTATWGWVTANKALMYSIFGIPVIGWALLLISVLVTLYFTWGRFHDAVNNTLRFIWENSGRVRTALLYMFGPLYSIVLAIQYILANIHKVGSYLSFSPSGDLGGPAKNTGAVDSGGHGSGNSPYPLFNVAKHAWGWLGGGSHSSSASVRSATSVAPLSNRDIAHSIKLTVVPGPVMMDGKRVGTVLAHVTTDKEARL